MGQVAEMVAERPLTRPQRRLNKMDRILAGLDDTDREIVSGWLHDLTISQEEVGNRLDACGLPVSETTVRRWRNRNVTAV